MENKREPGGTKSDKFFAGKGFYIVLFLCLAVIGGSIWALLSGPSASGETGMPDVNLEAPADGADSAVPADSSAGSESDYESAMWEIPEGTEELPVEPQAPEPASETPSQPETCYDTARAFIWPVVGSIETPYSVTALIYDTTMSDWRTHDGVDIAAPLGGKVMAASSGTVAKVYSDQLYGTTVVIDHGEGLCSIYANLAELPTVKAGDAVLTGETIGAVGATALCEIGKPTHLHFAMTLDGESVDPNDYLPAL
jgi:murein DD-endopeptidase MepM/ murein hydrolase activator NlpD